MHGEGVGVAEGVESRVNLPFHRQVGGVMCMEVFLLPIGVMSC